MVGIVIRGCLRIGSIGLGCSQPGRGSGGFGKIVGSGVRVGFGSGVGVGETNGVGVTFGSKAGEFSTAWVGNSWGISFPERVLIASILGISGRWLLGLESKTCGMLLLFSK